MSIRVDIEKLESALSAFGPGYLLTVSGAGRVKAVTVEPHVSDGALDVTSAGRGSRTNVEQNAAVTVLFPPAEPRGYTLLVDGAATVVGEAVRIVPETAVLHRPAAHADGPPPPDGCSNDCSRL